MAAIFAGASRALLASVVFAFETTHQPFGLLPLLGGCTAAYLVSCLLMKNTIMTEKIVRRGVRVPAEYSADPLGQVLVRSACSSRPVTLPAHETLQALRERLERDPGAYSHQGYPVVDAQGRLLGVLTRRDFLESVGQKDDQQRLQGLLRRKPIVIHPDQTLREAADVMTRNRIGRLVVVGRDNPTQPIGMLTRSDLLGSNQSRLREDHDARRSMRLGFSQSKAEERRAHTVFPDGDLQHPGQGPGAGLLLERGGRGRHRGGLLHPVDRDPAVPLPAVLEPAPLRDLAAHPRGLSPGHGRLPLAGAQCGRERDPAGAPCRASFGQLELVRAQYAAGDAKNTVDPHGAGQACSPASLGFVGGASVGGEGPTVQISASIFASIGHRMKRYFPNLDVQSYLVAGAGAGIAARLSTRPWAAWSSRSRRSPWASSAPSSIW